MQFRWGVHALECFRDARRLRERIAGASRLPSSESSSPVSASSYAALRLRLAAALLSRRSPSGDTLSMPKAQKPAQPGNKAQYHWARTNRRSARNGHAEGFQQSACSASEQLPSAYVIGEWQRLVRRWCTAGHECSSPEWPLCSRHPGLRPVQGPLSLSSAVSPPAGGLG